MGSHGVYVPKIFKDKGFSLCDVEGHELQGRILSDIDMLDLPDTEFYWEAWENVLNNVCVKGEDGEVYMLHHNQDLWAINKNDVECLSESESDKFWGNYNS